MFFISPLLRIILKFRFLFRNETTKNLFVEVSQPEDPRVQQGNRETIFTKIFGKKITKDKGKSFAAPEKIVESKPESPVNKYSRKTINRLKSINFVFKKVDGFNEKCRQLVSTRNGILAATNKGLLLIRNHKTEIVAGNRYINFISWQPVDDEYFIAAEDGYFSVKYVNGKWLSESPDPTIYQSGIFCH